MPGVLGGVGTKFGIASCCLFQGGVVARFRVGVPRGPPVPVEVVCGMATAECKAMLVAARCVSDRAAGVDLDRAAWRGMVAACAAVRFFTGTIAALLREYREVEEGRMEEGRVCGHCIVGMAGTEWRRWHRGTFDEFVRGGCYCNSGGGRRVVSPLTFLFGRVLGDVASEEGVAFSRLVEAEVWRVGGVIGAGMQGDGGGGDAPSSSVSPGECEEVIRLVAAAGDAGALQRMTDAAAPTGVGGASSAASASASVRDRIMAAPKGSFGECVADLLAEMAFPVLTDDAEMARMRGLVEGVVREKGVTVEEGLAVCLYTYSIGPAPHVFREINAALRGGGDLPRGYQRYVRVLCEAIEKLAVHREDGVALVRGMRPFGKTEEEQRAEVAGWMDLYKIGREIEWGGFTSTSTDAKTVVEYMGGVAAKRKILFSVTMEEVQGCWAVFS
jgi:hypothetical protein